jgi:hypothetical protein
MTQRTSRQDRFKGPGRLAPRSGLSSLDLERNRAIAGEPAAIPVRAGAGVTG